MKLTVFLAVALLFAVPAKAAITFINAADLGNNGGSTSTLSASYSVTTGSSVLYVVVLGERVSLGVDDISSVTYGGVSGSLQLKDTATNAGGNNRYKYTYAIFSPPSGSNNVVITALSSHYLLSGVVEYKNSILSGPPDSTSKTDAGIVQSVTGSTTTVAANTWVLGIGEQEDNSSHWNQGTGDVLRSEDGVFFTWAIFDSNGPVNPPGSYSMSVSVTGTVISDLVLDMLSFAPSGTLRSLMHVGQ